MRPWRATCRMARGKSWRSLKRRLSGAHRVVGPVANRGGAPSVVPDGCAPLGSGPTRFAGVDSAVGAPLRWPATSVLSGFLPCAGDVFACSAGGTASRRSTFPRTSCGSSPVTLSKLSLCVRQSQPHKPVQKSTAPPGHDHPVVATQRHPGGSVPSPRDCLIAAAAQSLVCVHPHDGQEPRVDAPYFVIVFTKSGARQ